MIRFAKTFAVLITSAWLIPTALAVSTPGGAKLTATINDLGAKSGSSHYTVVWVTKADNTFITTLWKQGNADFTKSNWTNHFVTWNTQRAGSTALPAAPDGYTSATATSYAITNPSPPVSGIASNAITITWNGKDSAGAVMPDGTYKFWIEYAEDTGTHGTDTGGLTTGGLSWVKGPAAATVNPTHASAVGSPAGGLNFTGMSIVWTPSTVAPTITSAALPSAGVQGTPYSHTMAATGSAPIAYSVTAGALPPPLTLSPGGVISGTPSGAGLFTGTITAANGTLPNATQNFSINIAQAIVITSAVPPATGNVGVPYNCTVTATGSGIITYAVSSGALPTGLILSTGGVISGTPEATGTFAGMIRASNGVASPVTQSFSITIGAALTVTPGTVTLTATLAALGSGSADHWSVAWLTMDSGTFVKTIDIRGNGMDFWDVHWHDHCTTWYGARAGSTALDGFTSATTTSYAAPLVATWNGRDATNTVMPDGVYKLWVQYAEDIDGLPGPVTTNGLTWTKGPGASTVNPAVPGGAFTNVSVVWTPVSAFDTWAIAAGLGAGADPAAAPKSDGVTNIEKYAFNMDGSKADVRRLTVGAGGLAGLPGTVTETGPVLRLEYIRRKASTNPGVTYTAQFGSDVTGWTPVAGTATSIDATWERVVAVDVPPVGATKRFGRVMVSQP